MADEMERGALLAADEMGEEVRVQRKEAKNATVDDVLGASGFLFCAPENLATVSGEMKEFFDRSYYDAFSTTATSNKQEEYSEESRLAGRPFGLAIAAGSDGTGAARQVERICKGWRLRPVADTLIFQNGLTQTKENILAPKGPLPETTVDACAEIGGRVSATLLLR